MTRTFGILGWPVAHSRSPAMHEAAFTALGMDAVYARFPVPPDQLAEAVRGLAARGVEGANVTVPHKQRVMGLLDEVEASARAIGAVNTLVRDAERWIGANTDAPGFVRSVVEAGFEPAGRTVVVVGAGGAARAVVMGLAEAGASSVTVAARRLEQAEALIADLRVAAGEAELGAVSLGELPSPLARADLLVQATSATLYGGEAAETFARSLPLQALPEHAVVTDLVYTPRTTTVMAAAEARGLRTIDGLGMLLYQGVLSFERWTGSSAPVAAMRAALEDES